MMICGVEKEATPLSLKRPLRRWQNRQQQHKDYEAGETIEVHPAVYNNPVFTVDDINDHVRLERVNDTQTTLSTDPDQNGVFVLLATIDHAADLTEIALVLGGESYTLSSIPVNKVYGDSRVNVLDGTLGIDEFMGVGRISDTFQGTIDELAGDTILDFSNRRILIVKEADLSALNGTEVTSTLTLADGKEITLTGLDSDKWTWKATFEANGLTILVIDRAETHGNDMLYGTPYGDRIGGKGGDDTIYSGDGSDDLNGNDGDDEIYAEGGKDWIDVSMGNDFIDGGEGIDMLAAYHLSDQYAVIDMAAGTAKFYNDDGSDWMQEIPQPLRGLKASLRVMALTL